MTPQQLARFIDHTLLKPEATSSDIQTLCEEAKENGFYAVCVNSRFVELCATELRGSPVKVAAVVGFPLGAMDMDSKAFEAAHAVKNGAAEIDTVIAIGAMKEKDWDYVRDDILAVVNAADGSPVKVILETHLLTDEEKIKACELSREAGAAFVKTSTGFSGGGAKVNDVLLMKTAAAPLQVKASGGVRTPQDAFNLVAAGATRLGTSSGVALIKGLQAEGNY